MKRLCKPFKANKDTLLSGTVNVSLHFFYICTVGPGRLHHIVRRPPQRAHPQRAAGRAPGQSGYLSAPEKTSFAFEAFFVTPNFVGFPPTCHVAILSCCLLTTDNFMFHRNSGLLYM